MRVSAPDTTMALGVNVFGAEWCVAAGALPGGGCSPVVVGLRAASLI